MEKLFVLKMWLKVLGIICWLNLIMLPCESAGISDIFRNIANPFSVSSSPNDRARCESFIKFTR
ncbi:CLUMA_CG016773, isoform A [Clunio marinus]|uniref:CLUMA_CG016773, isoform A n=1 Tax=Clunio marinus TaxID=568069 RepID=A0A1J1IVK5_9DIPT|nr:CLUMA_CG016773, isoform A [Clunio marinus]